ncbi:cell division protein FtsA [Serratia marcescens]|nr:cell division protein FtsA [Serratia marcescens]RTF99066.1 cell division protein FtsA [Serratia marcescens]
MFIGFDYGTANCSVAVMRDHGPELLTLENNAPYLPSMLCAPTREAVSECLHRHWQIPTGSEENQQLLRRAISYNREEDIPVNGDSVLFGLQALAHYMEDPEEVYFVRSPKSFLGANGLKPQQIALFEDLVCAMMFHIKRQAENVLQTGIDQAVIGRPINFQGIGGDEANRQAQGILQRAAERAGFKDIEFQFEPVAAGLDFEATLSEEQTVLVVDIGGGTMDMAVYTGGALRHTKVIPYAGNVVTSDIAYAFGTPPTDAEAIKVRHGCALGSIVSKDENVEVPSVGGRPPRSLQRQTLAEVIEPRYTELLNLVNDEILQLQEQLRQQGVKHHLAAGIVLTGGAAQIDGLAACAQRVFHTQVRIGQPLNITGLTDYAQEPYYSTAVGLLHYGKESHLSGETEVEKRASVGNWFKRINSWLRKEF